MPCYSTTSCGSMTAFIDCLPGIYQGGDYQFELLLKDELGNPIDLNTIHGIFMRLFGDKYSYVDYAYPSISDTNPIEILQTNAPSGTTDTDNNGIIDEGYIAFKLYSEDTLKMMTGNLYAEIKFQIIDTNWPGGIRYKIISCLKIGEIKLSKTKDITDF